MKAGVITSVVVHSTLLILAVVGLSSARPLEPQVVESIAVDLVPISEVTNIRMGSLDSTVVETDTPAIVETETPAELAQPTGNTQEDQQTPQETTKETPAPVVNTAPEPEAEPVVEPEPVAEEPPPVEAPATEPEPAPEEAAPPQEVATPTPAEAEPKQTATAPVPRLPPAAILLAPKPKKPEAVKTAEAKPPVKPAESAKPKPAEQKPANEQAKPADQVAALINNEDSRGATTGAGGTPTLGRNDGRSATLSQSQIDGLIAQIKNCQYYNPPVGAADAGVTAMLRFSTNGNGDVTVQPQIMSGGATQLERALASAAQRGVMRCGPYKMAVSQDVQAIFDPRLM